MKITFENSPNQSVDRQTNKYSSAQAVNATSFGERAADISGTVTDNNAYGVHGWTAEEVMQEAGAYDVTLQRNYMAVMSNSMSTEDFAKLQKEGIDPTDTEIEVVVTILDTIKAELIKSGTYVAGYTDQISGEELEAITGSKTLANTIQNEFAKNDIPVTTDTATQIMEAYNKAKELSTPSEGETKYLVENNVEPTIHNLYTAEHAGAYDANRQGKGYFSAELPGYYSKKAEGIDADTLKSQVEALLSEYGIEAKDETIEQGLWLVEKGIPLTKENMEQLSMVSKLELPIEDEKLIEGIASAMIDGKSALDANIYDTRNKYQKAVELAGKIEKFLESPSIKNQRLMEEARLKMTTEVNVRLIESGFSIDTADLEQLVEALRAAEEKQAQAYFPEEDTAKAVEFYSEYRETIQIWNEIPFLPVDTIGKFTDNQESFQLGQVYEEGKQLQAAYEKAGTSYETMGTEIRKDLGDSIKKAFSNVDQLLESMGQEPTETNRKAVRILGYNSIPITEENLNVVKEKEALLSQVMEKMKPAKVLQMIREGVHPLETDMNQLNSYLDGQADELNGQIEQYSRYLYELEQKQDITPEEREAYIGVYRMLRQIEKTDSAAIGRIVESGVNLSFDNILSAMRSAKKAGINITVDEQHGSIVQAETDEKNISEQLEQIKQIRNVNQTESRVIQLLQDCKMPVTVQNLMAADQLCFQKNRIFQKLREESKNPKAMEKMSEDLIDGMEDKETAQVAYQEFIQQSEEVLEEAVWDPEKNSTDIKALKLLNKQLHIAGEMARQEVYEMPVAIGDEMVSVRLSIQHGGQKRGSFEIRMNSQNFGEVTVFASVYENKISGCMVLGKEAAAEGLEEELKENLENAGYELQQFGFLANQDTKPFQMPEEAEAPETKELYQISKIFINLIRQKAA